jgi:hypothetical protein
MNDQEIEAIFKKFFPKTKFSKGFLNFGAAMFDAGRAEAERVEPHVMVPVEPTLEILTTMAYLLRVVPHGEDASEWLPTLHRQYVAAIRAAQEGKS